MEVHHHAHTARKKWTHYFWEFFMLFLAVFCGFLAENQREHFVEHRREKTYMRSLVVDLQKDTGWISSMSSLNNELMLGLDSLVVALDTANFSDKKQLNNIYALYYSWGSTPHYVKFSNRTISQLQAAGGMRLIRKQEVSDSIMFYYALADLCDKQFDSYMDDMTHMIELSYKLFDKLYQDPGHEQMKLAESLFNQNPVLVREFINRVRDLKEVVGSYVDLLRVMTFMANQLMNKIIKEYHLE